MNEESDRDQLARLVHQWNENRLDLFHLSYPTEELEIEGVMRFYFQDGGERVLTKCVRVSSTATTRAVIEALADKFLPDLKMLTDNHYTLWEVHENGTERRLDDDEKPLLVQLNWHRDDREGRFLLRRVHNFAPLSTIQLPQDRDIAKGARYSKRDKKENKKKGKEIVTVNGGREEPVHIGDIYRQVPQNTFTRTISNPEAVMKKKRERKVEERLKQMQHGGSLKIYGGDVVPSKPYVSILVSTSDRAERILADVVEKYALDNSKGIFSLVEHPLPGSRSPIGPEGRLVHPHEFPLQTMIITENGPETYLALRRTTSEYASATIVNGHEPGHHIPPSPAIGTSCSDPAFLVMQPDGMTTSPPQWVTIRPGITEVGSDRSLAQYSQQAQNIYIDGPGVCGRHCVITFMERVVTITPSAPEARIEINGGRVVQTQILQHGDVIVIGKTAVFKFSSDRSIPEDINSNYSRLTPLCSRMRRYASSQQLTSSVRYADSNSQSVASPHLFRKRGEKMRESNNNLSVYSTLPNFSSDQLRKLLTASTSSRQSSEHMEPRLPVKVSNAYASLPISLQIGDYKVWDYLVEVMSRGFTDSTQFRLAPAYALYLALKFFHSHSKPYLVQFCKRIDHNLGQISEECTNKDELLFWLANASEFSFLVDHNPDLRLPRSGNLSSMVEQVFRRLCTVLVGAIRPVAQPLLDIRISNDAATHDLLTLLNNTLRIARSSRLNAALTIQVSGHMFHAINAVLFNTLVGSGTVHVVLTTRLGMVLLQRIEEVHRWAEQMGVELAAECHLDRIKQAAILLAAQKNDVATLGATCYKLNSLQVRHLLTRFQIENGEIPCDADVIGRVVSLAERQADQLTLQDGLPLTLEEVDHLSLPFMSATDGYVAETLRSVPAGLAEYLFALETKGLCNSVSLSDQNSQQNTQQNIVPMQRSASQTTLTSLQTTQFGDSFGSNGDDIVRVTLKRGSGGIGLSIVAAQGIGDRQTGIYVKKVVDNTPASKDGRLSRGDQLLSVNGQSLLAITQEEAALLMQRSGPEVRFEVKKGAANRNGLHQWLDGEKPTGVTAPNNGMSQSLHSTLDTGSHDLNYSSISKTSEYRNSPVQPPPAYQQRQQPIHSRGSAFVPPGNDLTRHTRSISASELYQNDPNATMSQRSIAGSTAGFDRLPAHYRQSNRPIVVQPGRITCPSPTSLRKTAPSPGGLYRPPSATNLFAPPKSSNPLQSAGYSSSSHRISQIDIHRAGTVSTPPQAQSSPIADSLPHHNPLPNYTSLPRQPVRVEAARPSERPVSLNMNGFRQEPAVVATRQPEVERQLEERKPVVPGAVPTAITQALAIQAAQAGGAPSRVARPTSRPQMEDSLDIRELEQRTQSLMTRESVEEELDRLDAKGINMTEEETRRYRALLNVAAEQSRQRVSVQPAVALAHQGRPRTETLIDDVQPSSSQAPSSSTPTSSRSQIRSIPVQQYTNSPTSPEVDSPGIVGAHEVYRDPRQRRLNEMQEDKRQPKDGERLDFNSKMRLFAQQIGEDTPKQRQHCSSAERHIQLDSHLSP